jgi:hypothetical protein
MMRHLQVGGRWAPCFLVLALCVPDAGAQETLPKLNSRVPSFVSNAGTGQKCLTDTNHHDPCATVTIRNVQFTIAWDANTSAITYIFTGDHHMVTDAELSVGGLCRLAGPAAKPHPTIDYLGWLLSTKWTDTIQGFSGDAYWYAALRKAAAWPEYGQIVGFLQSRYLAPKP